MKDQKRPDGTAHGNDLPDAGNRTGVTDTYGANLNKGYNPGGSIASDTKSDPADECYNKKSTK